MFQQLGLFVVVNLDVAVFEHPRKEVLNLLGHIEYVADPEIQRNQSAFIHKY